jgi:hypothetical protein
MIAEKSTSFISVWNQAFSSRTTVSGSTHQPDQPENLFAPACAGVTAAVAFLSSASTLTEGEIFITLTATGVPV